MPSSYAESFPGIVQLLQNSNPARVLDVGPGWGKYGLACREYLPSLIHLDAVEVPEGRKSTQAAIYDCVWEADVRLFNERAELWGWYDLVLMIDVLEHMSVQEGSSLLERCMMAGCDVVVSTPLTFFEQHVDGNPFEDHRSLWSPTDFERFGIVKDLSTPRAIICLLRRPNQPPQPEPEPEPSPSAAVL